MSSITKSELIYGLRELVLSLEKQWKDLAKKQNAVSREEMVGFRDGTLIPILDKITLLVGNAIRLEKYSDFEDGFKMLADIYQVAGKVERFGVAGQEHLSWTISSKLALEYIYIVGALAVKHKNFDALENLLKYCIEYPDQYPYESVSGKNVLLLSHPFFSSESREGDLRTFFDDAKKVIGANKIYLEWFDENIEKALDQLVQFDFLKGFYLHLHEENTYGNYHNFKRFYGWRVHSIIRSLLSNPGYKKIYGDSIKENLLAFLQTVDQEKRHMSDGWSFGHWKTIKELG